MLTPAEGVVAQEDGGELFLLHLATGHYYTLNRTGTVVWRALETGGDPLDAVRQRWPSVPDAQLSVDVDAVLEQLTKAALVVDASA